MDSATSHKLRAQSSPAGAHKGMSHGDVDTSGGRIHAIDFTKGALVLLMVVYHALNYLGYESIPHDYLGFVPSSFIMITGFLVWQIYSPRRQSSFPAVAMRLASRALKLIALFTVLNVAARLVWSRNRYGIDLGISSFLGRLANIYLAGDPEGVAFEVLLPISYTLLLSIVLLLIPPPNLKPCAPWA